MPIQHINEKTLQTWLQNDEAVIVDVREPGEHGALSIPEATLLPLAKVCIDALPPHTDKKLVLHCKAGKRGESACKKLLGENPDLELYHLEGGIDAWHQAGNPVDASNKFFMTLDRQVQLTIGSAVLIGIILGYLVHPYFIILSAFFGLGMVNAGITGWCGLAVLMAKMPWNQKS